MPKLFLSLKKGDRHDMHNYRPISLLPALSKILERIIYKRLFGYLSQLNILQDSQFGFRPGLSSYMALLEAYNKIVSDMDDRKYKFR